MNEFGTVWFRAVSGKHLRFRGFLRFGPIIIRSATPRSPKMELGYFAVSFERIPAAFKPRSTSSLVFHQKKSHAVNSQSTAPLRTGTRAGQYYRYRPCFFFAGKKCCEKSRKTVFMVRDAWPFVASLGCIPTSLIHASQRQNTTLIAVFERKGQLALLGRS